MSDPGGLVVPIELPAFHGAQGEHHPHRQNPLAIAADAFMALDRLGDGDFGRDELLALSRDRSALHSR